MELPDKKYQVIKGDCLEVIPKIDDKYLLNVLKQYKHTTEEMKRNKNIDIFTNFKIKN